ncbi:hypothetical protein DL771_004683 [Monosporascus sp. 5C6A]|nr:hypothetical protein DL771_004683 [Monosporascus sp. 5C6A]
MNVSGPDYSWLSVIDAAVPVGHFVFLTGLAWGVILLTTPACSWFVGMATNRFLLGLLEAAVNPTFVFIMSFWYTAAEQPLRCEAYYWTNRIATMSGALMGYAAGHIGMGLPR